MRLWTAHNGFHDQAGMVGRDDGLGAVLASMADRQVAAKASPHRAFWLVTKPGGVLIS